VFAEIFLVDGGAIAAPTKDRPVDSWIKGMCGWIVAFWMDWASSDEGEPFSLLSWLNELEFNESETRWITGRWAEDWIGGWADIVFDAWTASWVTVVSTTELSFNWIVCTLSPESDAGVEMDEEMGDAKFKSPDTVELCGKLAFVADVLSGESVLPSVAFLNIASLDISEARWTEVGSVETVCTCWIDPDSGWLADIGTIDLWTDVDDAWLAEASPEDWLVEVWLDARLAGIWLAEDWSDAWLAEVWPDTWWADDGSGDFWMESKGGGECEIWWADVAE
jgi:hypothetical protein